MRKDARLKRIIERCSMRLRPIMNNPPSMCWVGDGGLNDSDLCFECAEKAVTSLKVSDPASRAFVDGGWDAGQESDSCCNCDECGKQLAYSLTSFGCSQELNHFVENLPKAPISPEIAYEIDAVLDEAPFHEEQLRDAARVGLIACRAVPLAKRGKTS